MGEWDQDLREQYERLPTVKDRMDWLRRLPPEQYQNWLLLRDAHGERLAAHLADEAAIEAAMYGLYREQA